MWLVLQSLNSQQVYNEWSLIDTGGALHWDSILDASHPPSLNLTLPYITTHTRVEKGKVNLFLLNNETIIWLLSKSMQY
jgi:hypothetical protein